MSIYVYLSVDAGKIWINMDSVHAVSKTKRYPGPTCRYKGESTKDVTLEGLTRTSYYTLRIRIILLHANSISATGQVHAVSAMDGGSGSLGGVSSALLALCEVIPLSSTISLPFPVPLAALLYQPEFLAP